MDFSENRGEEVVADHSCGNLGTFRLLQLLRELPHTKKLPLSIKKKTSTKISNNNPLPAKESRSDPKQHQRKGIFATSPCYGSLLIAAAIPGAGSLLLHHGDSAGEAR
jgi:hypothetical protein